MIDGGERKIKTFEFQPATTSLPLLNGRMTGKSILYSDKHQNNLTNIWAQPIDGGAPKTSDRFQRALPDRLCLVTRLAAIKPALAAIYTRATLVTRQWKQSEALLFLAGLWHQGYSESTAACLQDPPLLFFRNLQTLRSRKPRDL